ncbi:MAG: 30S ribosomal protein S20 [Mycoplasmataceae bacterium]|jgi:small subunit ribosomal protein S20|nr:30S ribosomal protein S20 [Mycoplasmataceae bacterium]
MANLSASKKNIRKIKKQSLRNKFVLTNLKTVTKNVIKQHDQPSLNIAYQKIDSALAKGKIHRNKANRLKSRLANITLNKKSAPVASAPAPTDVQKNS